MKTRECVTVRDILQDVRMDLEYADIPKREIDAMMAKALLNLITPEIRDRIENNERADSLKSLLEKRHLADVFFERMAKKEEGQ